MTLTCQGYSCTSVSTPPTILVCPLGTPQIHVEFVFIVAEVVVVVSIVAVDVVLVVVVGAKFKKAFN